MSSYNIKEFENNDESKHFKLTIMMKVRFGKTCIKKMNFQKLKNMLLYL